MILTHSVKVCLATRPCDLRMHNQTEEELPGLLPAAWLKAQGDPATADDRAVA
jgi:hypothetical protein